MRPAHFLDEFRHLVADELRVHFHGFEFAQITRGEIGLLGYEVGGGGKLARAHEPRFVLEHLDEGDHGLADARKKRLRLVARGDRILLRGRCCAHLLFSCKLISWCWICLAMPMPPEAAMDLAYCSVSIERHTPLPAPAPKGPSSSRPSNMFSNMLVKNTPSKSCETFFVLSAPAAAGVAVGVGARATEVGEKPIAFAITSPRSRPGLRPRP